MIKLLFCVVYSMIFSFTYAQRSFFNKEEISKAYMLLLEKEQAAAYDQLLSTYPQYKSKLDLGMVRMFSVYESDISYDQSDTNKKLRISTPFRFSSTIQSVSYLYVFDPKGAVDILYTFDLDYPKKYKKTKYSPIVLPSDIDSICEVRFYAIITPDDKTRSYNLALYRNMELLLDYLTFNKYEMEYVSLYKLRWCGKDLGTFVYYYNQLLHWDGSALTAYKHARKDCNRIMNHR